MDIVHTYLKVYRCIYRLSSNR